MAGYAPGDESENRIYGIKKGLEFIGKPANTITEDNIYQLYEVAVGGFLPEEDRLLPGHHYRHDAVYIVGEKVEHTGLNREQLSEYMGDPVSFIHESTPMNDLIKAALIHFYIAYLHPYLEKNGTKGNAIISTFQPMRADFFKWFRSSNGVCVYRLR